MAIEMNKNSSIRIAPVQEFKLTKPASELYIGQVLKTIVVSSLSNNEVMISLNGQNLNAKSSHPYKPGEVLEVKVIATHGETVLEVVPKDTASSILQEALLHALPQQAPATGLLNTLQQVTQNSTLPEAINLQIKALLNSITPLALLPQQLMQAINNSGVFLEANLERWQRSFLQQGSKNDFKALCLKLLASLPQEIRSTITLPDDLDVSMAQNDPLPLAGAIPQPLHKTGNVSITGLSAEAIQQVLAEQIHQVLARITSHQVQHLNHDQQNGYLMMLDLPVRTPQGVDVIPLMIQHHKAQPLQPAKWSIDFAVSLDRLGDLQANISLSDMNIDIKVNAANPSTLTELEPFKEEMAKVLQSQGLHLRHWKLQAGLEDNQIDTANLRLLDLRI